MASADCVRLSTERLHLVELDPETHASEINASILDTFDTLHPWMRWAERPPSLEDTRRDLERFKESGLKGDLCFFGIYSKEHSKLIGTCVLIKLRSPRGNSILDQVDSPSYRNPWLIGYWINKHYEGRGYVNEACKAMLDYGVKVLSVDCYLAQVNLTNEKSSKVVTRLGFSLLKEINVKNNGVRSDWPEITPLNVYEKLVNSE